MGNGARVRVYMASLLAVMLLLASPSTFAHTRCLGESSNPELEKLRAIVDKFCEVKGRGCRNAPNRREYKSCVMEVLAASVKVGSVDIATARAIKVCASKSACGRAGYVACLLDTVVGPSCQITRESMCHRDGGVPSACASCCDACDGECGIAPFCAMAGSCAGCLRTFGCQLCQEPDAHRCEEIGTPCSNVVEECD